MKKIVLIIAMVLVAIACIDSYKSNACIGLDDHVGETYEATGIVTHVEKDLVAFKVDMPDGSIQSWAAHGSGFEQGQLIKMVAADSDTPNVYGDDTIVSVSVIQ